jgi:hypothetical protein
MASNGDFVYYNARVLLGSGALNLLSASLNCALVTAGYGPLPTDIYLSAVPAGAMLARDLAVTAVGFRSNGMFYGTIAETAALLNPNPVVGMIMYNKLSTDGASPLIYYSSTGVGFPFLTQGLLYQVAYDQANQGFFIP